MATIVTVVSISCAHGGSDVPGTNPMTKDGVWWASSLRLPSLNGIDSRLEEPFPYPFEVSRVGDGLAPTSSKVVTNCKTYFTLQSEGYAPRVDVDAAALKVEGANCLTLRALRKARSPSRPVAFLLQGNSLGELPADLAPAPSPLELERKTAATRSGSSWHAYDGSAILSVKDPYRGSVAASGSTTDLEILAQADFDGNGTMDTLLLTISGGRTGTWSEIHLRMLTRQFPAAALSVVSELPL